MLLVPVLQSQIVYEQGICEFIRLTFKLKLFPFYWKFYKKRGIFSISIERRSQLENTHQDKRPTLQQPKPKCSPKSTDLGGIHDNTVEGVRVQLQNTDGGASCRTLAWRRHLRWLAIPSQLAGRVVQHKLGWWDKGDKSNMLNHFTFIVTQS